MEDAHKRLQQVIEYLRSIGQSHNQQDMADKVGMAKSNFSRAIKGAPYYFTEGFLKRFAKAYSGYINEDWLLTGEGSMEKADEHKTRTHIPMSVAAGPTGVAISSVAESEAEHWPIIAALPSYDFTINVMGDSMLPVLSDGDTVACRRVTSPSGIKDGALYVIETTEGAVVKQIANINTGAITLHSLNPHYKDYAIRPETIISISQVVGLIRPFPFGAFVS